MLVQGAVRLAELVPAARRVPATQIGVVPAGEPPVDMARAMLALRAPATARVAVRGTTALVLLVVLVNRRHRRGPTVHAAQRVAMRAVRLDPVRMMAGRLVPVRTVHGVRALMAARIAPADPARRAIQIVLVGPVPTVAPIVLVGPVPTVAPIVLVGPVRTAIRIVPVGPAPMVAPIVLVGSAQTATDRVARVLKERPIVLAEAALPVGSAAIRVRTLAWNVPAVRVPSARHHAALAAQCLLPISARSSSRTSAGQSPSASRLRRRRGNVSNGSMKARCARRQPGPHSAQPPTTRLVAAHLVPNCHQR